MNKPLGLLEQHTPGPWEISPTVNTTSVNIFGNPANAVYHIGTLAGSSNKHIEEFKANARLIAAAPELLDALQSAFDFHRDEYGDGPLMRKMSAALTKAKGAP